MIWLKGHWDELVMTVSLFLIATGIFVGATLINTTVGGGLLIFGIVVFGLGVIWKP